MSSDPTLSPVTTPTMSARSMKSVWHPCTQMKHLDDRPPLAIVKAQGAYLYDENNTRYIDGISSWWTCIFGHNHPAIRTALIDQLETLDHIMLAGFTHEPVVELSERLQELTGLGHAFYSCDGASSVEVALKISAHYWRNMGYSKKHQFIALEGGYHGETLGALGVTDLEIFKRSYGAMIHLAETVPVPKIKPNQNSSELQQAVDAALSTLNSLLEKRASHTAAMIIEPLVLCASGMVMYPTAYLAGVAQCCHRHNVHLIIDEIAVGFGRTGKMFAHQHAQIKPDLLCLSKGLTGGTLPLSVTLSSDKIFNAFLHDDVRMGFLHSHSYTGNPLLCRAALATLNIFESTDVLADNARKSEQFTKIFQPLSQHPSIEHSRHIGMIWAWDVAPNMVDSDFSRKFSEQTLLRGVLLRPIGRTIYCMPPYCFSLADAQHLTEASLAALAFCVNHRSTTQPSSYSIENKEITP
jgi:adenosylmethionine---8-amino-7-oxononanoate aminotransferase